MMNIDFICRQVLMSAYLYYKRGESVLTDTENDLNVAYLVNNWRDVPERYLALLDHDNVGSTAIRDSTFMCRYTRMVEGGAIAWLEAKTGKKLERLKYGYTEVKDEDLFNIDNLMG